jgi:hypothetical protein
MKSQIRALILATLVAGPAAALGAQAKATDVRRDPALVRVQVMDSTGTPIEGAEVSLMRGLRTVLATARTNQAGEHEFLVDRDSTDYSVVARKVGYARGDRFIAVEKAAMDARVIMRQLPSLPAVTVTAVNLKRKSYHLDADDIASSETHVNDALDIVRFIKPDMATSRSGGVGAGCSAMQNIWVNGRWYPASYVIVDPTMRLRLRVMSRGMQMMGSGNATILSEIAPEHIAEMNYVDCFEKNETKRVGAINALFVTLKPGVGYRLGYGTYVAADTATVVSSRK